MKSKFTWIMTLLLVFCIQISFAQQKTISGTVTSKADKMSVPGVNVVVEGTNRGVQTDFDGKYEIKASVGEKLVFSSVGSKTQVVKVSTNNVINIQLEDENILLEAVVIEGYDKTRTKAMSNVASTTVDSKVTGTRPNATFVQSLQNRLAGVDINTGSGQPGASSNVIIRGIGTATGQTSPLYVVDGIPMTSSAFRSINPEDIESTTVLSDAGATAIFGNRGANGVIVVYTKKGGYDTGLKVKYASTVGFSIMPKDDYGVLNSQQLLKLEKEYGRGTGFGQFNGSEYNVINTTPLTDNEIATYKTYDWQDYFFNTGLTNSHDLSFSQGGKNVNSYISFGYFDQTGIAKNTDLKRFSFRSNINGKSTDERFNYGTSFSLNYSKQNINAGEGSSNIVNNPLTGAKIGLPYLSPEGYLGSQDLLDQYLNGRELLYTTPWNLMDYLKNVYYSENVKMISAFRGSYKLAKALTLSSALNIDASQTNNVSWNNPDSFVGAYLSLVTLNSPGSQSENFSRYATFNSNTKLNYVYTIGKSTIDASIFMEYLKTYTKSFGYSKNGLNPKSSYPGAGTGFEPVIRNIQNSGNNAYDFNAFGGSSGLSHSGLLSYFGTVDYDYDRRFGLVSTIRRDGSYRFVGDNQWGTFFSFSARWNIDREKFMDGTAFNMLKLRASYGSNGNQSINAATRFLYGAGSGYNNSQAYLPGFANPDLKWESVYQANIGIDFGVWQNKLSGKVDVYNKFTKDLFQANPISAAVGFGTAQSVNFGSMSNKGVELTLFYDLLKQKDGFNIGLNANGAFNETKWVELPYTGVQEREGHIYGEYWMVRYIGVNPDTGNLLFLDKDGNKTENPDQNGADNVYLNKSSRPKYTGGFGVDVDYKGFYFNAQFGYSIGAYAFDYDLYNLRNDENIGFTNVSSDLLRAWKQPGDITDVPKLHFTNASSDQNSTYGLVNASYLKIRNMRFGYVVPSQILKKGPFTSINIFVQGENLHTWSEWRGKDVENAIFGGGLGTYPASKIYTFGLQLEF